MLVYHNIKISKPAHLNVKYKKDHFYSRNRQLDHRFAKIPKKSNKVIYTQKDPKMILQQSKIMRESFQNQTKSWQKDLENNNSQHEIIKKIISSTTQESTKTNTFPSDKNITQNYFPVKSMNTHIINTSGNFRKNIKQSYQVMNSNSDNKIHTVKVISRSLPRSPLKKREVSQEIDIYKRDTKTGQLIKSGKRIITMNSNIKRGR